MPAIGADSFPIARHGDGLEAAIFDIFRTGLALAFLLGLLAAPAAAQPRAAMERAEAVLAEIAEPIFAAAETSDFDRFEIEVGEGRAPKAMLLSKTRARVNTGLFRIVERPEQLAAAVAWLVSVREIEGAPVSEGLRYSILSRPPDDAAYSGTITSIDEALANPSEQAAQDVLGRQGTFGPDMERLRSRAERLDGEAIKILRRADISSRALISLYEAMDQAGAGLLDRHDYAGGEVLRDQIEWLRRRTPSGQGPRTHFWQELDDDLEAIKAALSVE